MSLQTKLTLLFTGLIGGTLAILGLLVFGLVNVILIDQIDMRLAITGQRMINQLTVNHENQIVINQLRMDNTLVQIWKNSSELIISNPPDMKNPLHENGLRLGENNYDTGTLQGVRIRVLTVPLKTSRGPVGILQVALDLSLLDITLKTLAAVLVSMLLIGLIVSSILSWFFTKKTLTPLMTVTNFARDITKTHDLSRRIPVDSDQSQDEVGQLISAFNETLSRLDQILVSQKQLVADISHELRTPLTVIKGEVGLMKKYKVFDAESLVSIEDEVDCLTRLVGNIIFLSQAETGEVPLDISEFALDDLVTEVVHQVKTIAGNRYAINISEILPIQIQADRDKIKQVLLNILGNAIQFTPEGGIIKIRLEKTGGFAVLYVEDNGPGIAKSDLAKLFDRFYRAKKSRTRTSGTGFGLGLSISQYIVQMHNGRIDVKSDIGKGTIFSMSLPIIQPVIEG